MGKQKHLSNEEKEYIKVNMLIKSVGAMADELGRNYYTIYKYIARTYGVERVRKFTAQEDKLIIDLYKKKVRVEEIAKTLGTDRCTIYNRARKLGVVKQVHIKRE